MDRKASRYVSLKWSWIIAEIGGHSRVTDVFLNAINTRSRPSSALFAYYSKWQQSVVRRPLPGPPLPMKSHNYFFTLSFSFSFFPKKPTTGHERIAKKQAVRNGNEMKISETNDSIFRRSSCCCAIKSSTRTTFSCCAAITRWPTSIGFMDFMTSVSGWNGNSYGAARLIGNGWAKASRWSRLSGLVGIGDAAVSTLTS